MVCGVIIARTGTLFERTEVVHNRQVITPVVGVALDFVFNSIDCEGRAILFAITCYRCKCSEASENVPGIIIIGRAHCAFQITAGRILCGRRCVCRPFAWRILMLGRVVIASSRTFFECV